MIAIIALWIILGIIAFIVILLHFSLRIYVSADMKGADIKVKYLFFTVYKMNTAEKKDEQSAEPPPKKKKEDSNEKASEEKAFEDNLEVTLEELDRLDEEEKKAEDEPDLKTEPEPEPKPEGEKQTEKEEPKPEKPLTKQQKKALKEKKKLEDQLRKEQKALEKAEKKAEGSKLDKLKAKIRFYKPYVAPTLKAVRKLLKKIRFKGLEIDIYSAKEDPSEAAIFYGKLQPIVFSGISLLGAVFTVKLKRCDITCGFFEKKLDFRVETKVLIRPSTVIAIAVGLGVRLLRIFLPGWWKRRRERKKALKAQKKAGKAAKKAAAAAV